MKKGAKLDLKGASLDNKKVRNWAMKKTHKKDARLGKKGAKMDIGLYPDNLYENPGDYLDNSVDFSNLF